MSHFLSLVCSHKAAPVANAGYKWSNGRYVPVAKAGADAKPHEVKFTMAKKKPVVVKPAYTQVSTLLCTAVVHCMLRVQE